MKTAHMRAAALLPVALLAGCSILGGSREPATIYAPEPQVAADPAWPHVDWQLSISPPMAARMVDSQRIAVRPTPGQIEVYKGAAWAKTPSEQLVDTVLRTLEDSGDIRAVARQGSGISADYKLVTELRRFDADYDGGAVPKATIEVNAKLLHVSDQDIVEARTFRQAVPAAATDVGSVARAFDQALGKVAHDMSGWILATGQAHQRQPLAPH